MIFRPISKRYLLSAVITGRCDHGLLVFCCRRNIGGIRKRAAATSSSDGDVGGTAPLAPNGGGASFTFRLHLARTSELCPGAPGGLIYGLIGLMRIIDSPTRARRRSTAWPGGCSSWRRVSAPDSSCTRQAARRRVAINKTVACARVWVRAPRTASSAGLH